nr:unnamed protein product [Digitaria exilis]
MDLQTQIGEGASATPAPPRLLPVEEEEDQEEEEGTAAS